VSAGAVLVEGSRAVGVLVLGGSSGRVEEERCRVLAGLGATALSYRWFEVAIDRVPLESFEEPLAELHGRCDRLVVLGVSRGAEAALLLGARHREIDAVVGISPTDVVWAALTTDRPQRSSWTSGGDPLPFVPYDDTWQPDTDPPEFRGLYEQALEVHADRVPAARLPVERIAGMVLLVAGGDDRVWPSVSFAERIVGRRAAAGLDTALVTHEAAGHRVVLPGETPATGGQRMARGGSPEADAELGRRAWPHLVALLTA
jgi:uncharacterized protein